MSLYELVRDGQTIVRTDDVNCIEDWDILKLENKAGYKFKLKASILTLKTLKEYINKSKGVK